MESTAALLSPRSSKIVLGVLLVFALFCTQIPLFNYLGFEFSALTSLLAGLVTGLWVISFSRLRPSRDSASDPSYPRPDAKGGFWTLVRQSTTFSMIALSLPFLVMTANAFFVKNCSLLNGLVFFLLIPVPGVLFSNALALLIAVTVRRWKRFVFVFLYIGILLHIAYVTFTGPQIFAFNPIIGYFPGITHDESLEILNRLVPYRVGTIVTAIIFVLLSSLVVRRRRTANPGELPTKLHPFERFLFVTSFAAVVLMFIFSNRFGFSSSQEYIKAVLGGVRETEHFVIVFPKEKVDEGQAQDLADMQEFYYFQLTHALRVAPVKKITVFLYRSAEEKGRLVGAIGTNIAKPWLWQVHLNLDDVNRTLRHELAHGLAAEFGLPLIRVGLNSGLIEGLAVAMERVDYDEPIHRAAALVYASGINPDMQSLFSILGFFKAQPTVSYTLAGSFCRFLIDRYGLRRFKYLYRTGDFRGFYNRDLSSLLSEWRRFLSRYHFDESGEEKGAYLFRRPTIFMKECARVIASMNDQTRSLYQQKNYSAALTSVTHSLELSTSVEAIMQRINILFKLQRFDELIDFAHEQLADTLVAHSLLPMKLVLGDALWTMEKREEARLQYEDLFSTHLSLGWDEASLMRLESLKDAGLEKQLKGYFTTDLDDSVRVALLENIATANPTAPLPKYLLGKELAAQEKWKEAIEPLKEIRGMGSDPLEFVRQRRIALLYFRLHEYQKAKIYFWQALNYVEREERVIEIQEWLGRCDWMEEIKRRSN